LNFQDYILYCHSIGDPIGQDFWFISTEDFEAYWLGHHLATLADFEPQPTASTAQNSLQFRPRQYSTVEQAHAQDFVEDLDPGYTARTQEERFMQKGILSHLVFPRMLLRLYLVPVRMFPIPLQIMFLPLVKMIHVLNHFVGGYFPTHQTLFLKIFQPLCFLALLKKLLTPAMLCSSHLPSFRGMITLLWLKVFLSTQLQLICKLIFLCRRKLDLMLFWLIPIALMRLLMMISFPFY